MFNWAPRRTPSPRPRERRFNVNPALDKDTHMKLYKLAVSCGKTKTKLAEELIRMAVNHPDIITHYQDLYNTDDAFRIRLILQDDKVIYG